MFRLIFSLIFIFIVSALGLTMYLKMDDLAGCNNQPSVNVDCKVVDAVVAISGGDTAARTQEAIDLFKNGWADKLIFSGAAKDKSGSSNAMVMKQIAIDEGVPEDVIYLDEQAESTRQNAEKLQDIFVELNIKKIILVTSGYHQRRASLEFEKRAGDIIVVNHSVESDKDWSDWWWITPRGWWLATNEVVRIGFFYTIGAVNYD